MKKYTQLVLVEFNNCPPYVETFESDNPIDIELVARYYIQTEYFNVERDSVTFVDSPSTIDIDTIEIDEEIELEEGEFGLS